MINVLFRILSFFNPSFTLNLSLSPFLKLLALARHHIVILDLLELARLDLGTGILIPLSQSWIFFYFLDSNHRGNASCSLDRGLKLFPQFFVFIFELSHLKVQGLGNTFNLLNLFIDNLLRLPDSILCFTLFLPYFTLQFFDLFFKLHQFSCRFFISSQLQESFLQFLFH